MSEANIAPLLLPPAKQAIVFRGRALTDDETLWGVGVRDDETLMLEFASPTMPTPLRILRAPAPEKKKKGQGVKTSPKKGAKSPKRR